MYCRFLGGLLYVRYVAATAASSSVAPVLLSETHSIALSKV
jgi:hypothetical protein